MIQGESGPGSPTLVLEMILRDLSAGKSSVVLDPYGDISDELLRLLPGLIRLNER